MLMICPERNCHRRKECAANRGHAVPHEHNEYCDDGCTLQDSRSGIWSDHKKRCIKYKGIK